MKYVEALRSENSRAVTALTWSLARVVFVNAATVALLFCPPSLSWVFLSVGLVLQLAGFSLRIKSEQHARRAQRLRHCSLMQNGLEFTPSPTQLALLSIHVGKVTRAERAIYYTSNEPPSERRLLSNVAESAFFSLNTAERIAGYLTWSAILSAVVMFFVVVIFVFGVDSSPQVKLATQVSLLIFSFLGTGEFAILAFRFRQGTNEGRDILAECDRIQGAGPTSVLDAMSVLCQYEIMMANCPPLPSWIYDRQREQLDDAWLNRSTEKVSVESSPHLG